MNSITITITAMTWFIGFIIPSLFLMSDFYLDKKYKKYKFTNKGLFLIALMLLPFIHGVLTFTLLFLIGQGVDKIYSSYEKPIRRIFFK